MHFAGALRLALCLALQADGAVADPPVEIRPASGELVIDGTFEDWAGVEERAFERGGGSDEANRADLRLCYLRDALYLAARVRDDHLVVPGGEGDLERRTAADHLELLLSPHGRDAEQDLVHLVFWPLDRQRPVEAVSMLGTSQPQLPAGLEQVSKERTEPRGFDLEVRLPWAGLGIDPAVDRELDLQVSWVDVDGTPVVQDGAPSFTSVSCGWFGGTSATSDRRGRVHLVGPVVEIRLGGDRSLLRRFAQSLSAALVLVGGLYLVVSSARRAMRRRSATAGRSIRRMLLGGGLVLLLALFVLPEVAYQVASRAGHRQLEDCAEKLRDAFATIRRSPDLGARVRGLDVAAIRGLLQGRGFSTRGLYRYSALDVLGERSGPSDYLSEGARVRVPFREYGVWVGGRETPAAPAPAGGLGPLTINLPHAEAASHVHLAVAAFLPDGVESIEGGLEVELRFEGGSAAQQSFRLYDARADRPSTDSGPEGVAQRRGGFSPRFEDRALVRSLNGRPLRTLDHLVYVVPDLQHSSEDAHVASITLRRTEAAEGCEVWLSAVTLQRGLAKVSFLPVDLGSNDVDGFPVALRPGQPARREVQVLAGDSYQVPLPSDLGPIDRLRVYYRAEHGSLFGSAAEPEGSVRAVVKARFEGIAEPLEVPLRTSLEIVQDVPPSGRLPDTYTSFVVSSFLEQGRRQHYTGFELPLPKNRGEGVRLAGLEVSVPVEANAPFRLAALTAALEVDAPSLPSDALLVEEDGRLRLHQSVTADIADPGSPILFAVAQEGLVQELGPGFEGDLVDRLRGTPLEIDRKSADEVVEIERLGRRFSATTVSFPREDADLRILLLRPIQSRAGLVRLWALTAFGAGIVALPLALLWLVQWLGRMTRIRSRLSILFLLTTVAPVVVVSFLLTRMLLVERQRNDLRRAESVLTAASQRLESLVQNAQALAESTHRQLQGSALLGSPREHEAEIRELLALKSGEMGTLGERAELRITVETSSEEASTAFFYSSPGGRQDRRWLAPEDGLSSFEGEVLYSGTFTRQGLGVRVSGKARASSFSDLGLHADDGESLALLAPLLRLEERAEAPRRILPGGTSLAGARLGAAFPLDEAADAADRLDRGEDRVVHQDATAGTRVYDLLRTTRGAPVVVLAVAVPSQTPTMHFGPLSLDVVWFATLVVGLGLACALFLGSAVTDGILRPLLRMQRGARSIEAREEAAAVRPVHDADEITQLADSFHDMAEELRRRVRDQEMLAAASAVLTRRLDLRDRVEGALGFLGEVLGSPLSACYLCDSSNETLQLEGSRGDPLRAKSLPARIVQPTGAIGRALRDPEPCWVGAARISASDASPAEREAMEAGARGEPATSLVLLPLGRAGRTTGVVLVHLPSGTDPLGTIDRTFLHNLLLQIAVALENARLYRRAVEDPQTGLYVHTYFAGRVSEEVDRVAETGGEVVLVRVRFLAAATGAELRARLASTLARELRRICHDREPVARCGELDFEILLAESGRSRAESILTELDRRRGEIAASVPEAGALGLETATVCFPEDGRSRDFLFAELEGRLTATGQSPSASEEWDRIRSRVETLSPQARFRAPRSLQVVAQIERAAQSDATVLVLGETGTGKEVLAELVHRMSRRAEGPFVAVHCAALPEKLLEAELFGHERGAFTGADRRRLGRFESAQGGTLFLDEVAEIPLEVQVKLLRVLQERRLQRLGSSEDVPVDVRLVAATHRRLEEMVAAGTFREDLYYRLQVVRVEMPPLRQRLEEIPALVDLFLAQASREAGREVQGIEPAALDVLRRHAWPGNVRELRNVIQRAVALGSGPLILRQDLQLESAPHVPVPESPRGSHSQESDLNSRQIHLLRMLEKNGRATTREYTEWTGVSQRTALRDLQELVQRGLVEREGVRKAATYRLRHGA